METPHLFSPSDWHGIMAIEDWREKYRRIEDGMRRLSAVLSPTVDISTTEYINQLFWDCGADVKEEGISRLMKVAKHVTDLRTERQEVATKGYNNGKTITRYRWGFVPYKPPAGPAKSVGAASPATSLQAQLADHNARINDLVASVADLRGQVQSIKESVDALQIPTNIAAYL